MHSPQTIQMAQALRASARIHRAHFFAFSLLIFSFGHEIESCLSHLMCTGNVATDVVNASLLILTSEISF